MGIKQRTVFFLQSQENGKSFALDACTKRLLMAQRFDGQVEENKFILLIIFSIFSSFHSRVIFLVFASLFRVYLTATSRSHSTLLTKFTSDYCGSSNKFKRFTSPERCKTQTNNLIATIGAGPHKNYSHFWVNCLEDMDRNARKLYGKKKFAYA